MIHSETTSGLINPIETIGHTIKDINPKVKKKEDKICHFIFYSNRSPL